MKIVWIIGAGASNEAGYPLVRDFLDMEYIEQWKRKYNNPLLNGNKIFDFLTEECEDLLRIGQNINDIMLKAITEENYELYNKVNAYITFYFQISQNFLYDHYSVTYLHAFGRILLASNSSVITLNYDTLVEEQLGYIFRILNLKNTENQQIKSENIYTYGQICNYLNMPYGTEGRIFDYNSGYILEKLNSTGTVKILKPHGSIGWYRCENCGNPSYFPHVYHQTARYVFMFGLADLSKINEFCHGCNGNKKDQDVFSNLYIPPTRNLDIPFWKNLEVVWQEAEQELEEAGVIIVAGYSFPKEDVEITDLLKKIKGKRKKVKAVIIEPFLDDIKKEHYATIFTQCLFFNGTFGDFISFVLKYWGGLVSEKDLRKEQPELTELLQLIFKHGRRPPVESPASIGFDRKLSEIIPDENSSHFLKSWTSKMLAFSNSPGVFMFLRENFFNSKSPDDRIIFASCLEEFRTQEALDLLAILLFDHDHGTEEPDELSNILSSISLVSSGSIESIIRKKSSLDFTSIIGSVLFIYTNSEPASLGQQKASSIINSILAYKCRGWELLTEESLKNSEIVYRLASIGYNNFQEAEFLKYVRDHHMK